MGFRSIERWVLPSLALLQLVLLGLIGCGTTRPRTYSGPVPAGEAIAVVRLPSHFLGSTVIPIRLDGVPVSSERTLGDEELEVLPGPHVLEFRYSFYYVISWGRSVSPLVVGGKTPDMALHDAAPPGSP